MTKPTSMKKLEGQIQHEVERDFADLELARDEIRLMIHLAGMDARTSWRELEKQFSLFRERADRESHHIADETWALARQLRHTFKEFRARL